MNYNNLKYIDYKGSIFIIVLLIIVYILLILSIILYSYDSYIYYGKYMDEYLYVSVPITNSDAVRNGILLQIDNKKYSFSIKEISDIYEINNLNYQDYKLQIKERYQDNEVLKITFYTNKERIIKKIIDFIFGKEK